MANQQNTALVVGSTGITGLNLATHLAAKGWRVYGLARKPKSMPGVTPVAADLQDAAALKAALADVNPAHVFICTWLRQDTEAENVRVNGDMVRNLFAALEGKPLIHAALVTGTKHYLGPFESYGQTNAETPFREDNPRLPGLNFYYTQEDLLFEGGAERRLRLDRASLALHDRLRPGQRHEHGRHTGGVRYALQGKRPALRLSGLARAVEFPDRCDRRAPPCQATGMGRHHLGGVRARLQHQQRRPVPLALAVAAARRLLRRGATGATEPDCPFGKAGCKTPPEAWKTIAAKYDLIEPDVNRLVSWWHTDGDLGRTIECVNDMTQSRLLGFDAYQPTPESFFELFDRFKVQRIIPG